MTTTLSIDALANVARVEVGKDYAMTSMPMTQEERAKWERLMTRRIQANQKRLAECAYAHAYGGNS